MKNYGIVEKIVRNGWDAVQRDYIYREKQETDNLKIFLYLQPNLYFNSKIVQYMYNRLLQLAGG